jgi:hypothetical protein
MRENFHCYFLFLAGIPETGRIAIATSDIVNEFIERASGTKGTNHKELITQIGVKITSA